MEDIPPAAGEVSQPELVSRVVRALDKAGTQYMVTGSLASSLQGEPRASHDIDIVIALERATVRKLISAFPRPEFHLDEDSINEAIARGSTFNLLVPRTGEKVDFWILTDSPFDRSRFARRYTEKIGGLEVNVSTPEDTILVKLWWAKLSGGSEKQFTDALRVYEVQSGKLDVDYLHSWAQKLGVGQMLQQLENEAETL